MARTTVRHRTHIVAQGFKHENTKKVLFALYDNERKDKMKQTYTLLTCLTALLATLLMGACNDDESFTTDPSMLLSFSTDTVKMDTVFSQTPTATKTMWVYNRSGKSIRCSTIRLENGNQTGFRVNVNGVYLGKTEGYQAHDIEIRKGDSVRVFVELTSPRNMKETPSLLQDNLIFTLESGAEQRICLNAYTWDAIVINQLNVSRDTTISSSRPIVVRQGIRIDSAATLTIAEGTTLYFASKAGIDVYGRLITQGTSQRNVTLRGDRIDRMFDYLPYDRVPGQWQGIRFHTSSYENQINYTDLHSAFNGIVCDSSDVSRFKLSLYNSIVHNCQGYGLIETNCVLDIFNTQITNTLNDCAAFFGGGVMLRHCTLAQFYPFDSNRGVALRFANVRNGRLYPLYQFDVYNTIVTGYADDEVMTDFDDKAEATYILDHCLLRTVIPDTIDTTRIMNVIWEDPKDTVNGGEKNFKDINADKQYYDFHLLKGSKAIDAGAVLPHDYSHADREGVLRDDKPDMGCYEYKE